MEDGKSYIEVLYECEGQYGGGHFYSDEVPRLVQWLKQLGGEPLKVGEGVDQLEFEVGHDGTYIDVLGECEGQGGGGIFPMKEVPRLVQWLKQNV